MNILKTREERNFQGCVKKVLRNVKKYKTFSSIYLIAIYLIFSEKKKTEKFYWVINCFFKHFRIKQSSSDTTDQTMPLYPLCKVFQEFPEYFS